MLFKSVFTTSSYSIPEVSNLPLPTHQLSQITVSESDVWSAFTSLDPDKTNGLDSMGPRLLRECATPLAAPFSIFLMLV